MKNQTKTLNSLSYSAEIDYASCKLLADARKIRFAAAMLQIPRRVPGDRPVNDASPEEWEAMLRPMKDAGFDAIELSCIWLDVAALAPSRRALFQQVLGELGLAVPGYLVVNKSVMNVSSRKEHVKFSHDAIDAARELGASFVCMGLHSIAHDAANGPYWFWNSPTVAADPAERRPVVEAFKDLCRHASEVGINLALEMYPDTFVGSAEKALQFLHDVDSPAFSINPDLGNFIRVQDEEYNWQEIAARILPHTRYWHVKNYFRLEHPGSQIVLTHPAPLRDGIVDYRKALAFARSAGFEGTIICEHYGGDGLSVSASSREYLKSFLR